MSDPIVVESYPCPSCDLTVNLQRVVDGQFLWACPNGHWWALDLVRGWLAINQPQEV
jgi:hypothetical protein